MFLIERLSLNAAAAAFNVSRKTAAKWLRRYRTLGLPGLRDHSSRPLHSPRRTSSELIAQVIGGWPTFDFLSPAPPQLRLPHPSRFRKVSFQSTLYRAYCSGGQ